MRVVRLPDAVAKLADPDPAVRDAALAVVVAAKQQAAPVLVDALGKPGAPVAKIALIVAALGARGAIKPLCDLVARGVLDADQRRAVARALAEIVDVRERGDGHVERALQALARDLVPATRADAEATLARIAPPAVPSSSSGASSGASGGASTAPRAAAEPPHAVDTTPVDFEALARAASDPFFPLVRQLEDPRRPARDAAVDALADAGPAVVPSVVGALSSPSPTARLAACLVLQRLRARDAAMPLVLHASSEPDVDVRAVALKALAACLVGDEQGIAELLVPLAREGDPFVRAGALLCLGRLADRVGARVAVFALVDPHDHVRDAAAVALSEGAREDHVELVLPLLGVLARAPRPSATVAEAVLTALSRVAVDDPCVVVRLRARVRRYVLGETAALRRAALSILERCFADDDPPPLLVVDDALSRLRDDHPEVRLLAASFLARHLEPGFPGAVGALVELVRRDEPAAASAALDALARHGSEEARAALDALARESQRADVAARAAEVAASFAARPSAWGRGAAETFSGPRGQEKSARGPAPLAAAPSAAPSSSAPSSSAPSSSAPSVAPTASHQPASQPSTSPQPPASQPSTSQSSQSSQSSTSQPSQPSTPSARLDLDALVRGAADDAARRADPAATKDAQLRLVVAIADAAGRPLDRAAAAALLDRMGASQEAQGALAADVVARHGIKDGLAIAAAALVVAAADTARAVLGPAPPAADAARLLFESAFERAASERAARGATS